MIIDSPIISGSYTASGSLNQVGNITITGSLTVTSGITGSVTNATSASYASTASFALNVPETASYATTAANAQNSDLLDGKNSTEFAVTSSNTFTGAQRITNTTNPVSFTDTASLYTDGGLRVTKDAYISGSAFIAGNFTVYGTSSIEYVTSSTFIGLEYIDLNTDLPALRYAGIRVYDSGSPSESTSSLLWDSQNNKWIYSNPSTVGYSGGMLISGPRNTGSLGEEQGTINNRIVKGQGGDHITSSQIIDDGTTVSIPGNLEVTGSIVGSLTGTAATASYWSGSIINAQSASYWSGSILNAQSASFASVAAYWSGSILNAESASFASTASFALNVPLTSSFALTASYWSGSIATSSFALTASYATNAGAGAGFPFSGSAVITGSLQITNLTGSGTAYLVADSTGSIQRQIGSAALKTTQAFTSSAGQTTFSVTNGYTTNYVDIFINGIKLSAGEFNDTSGTNIVLTTGSFDGDIVEVVKYLPAEGVSTNVLRQQTTFVATEGQTVFSSSYSPGLLDIFYNGSKLSYTEYTANNGTFFTLATASAAGDVLDVYNYSYQIGGFTGIGGSGVASQVAYFNTTNAITGSPNFTISGSTMTVTGSLVVSGSGTFTNIGPAVMSGSLNVSGAITTNSTITAQTLVVQTITSSVSVITGSTNWGSLAANTHTFTGSILASGSIGIGTIPSFPLEVSSTSTGLLGRFTSNQNEAQIRLVNTSTGGRSYSIGSGGTSSGGAKGFYIYDETAGSTVFAISGSGQVGIGTNVPSHSLQINLNSNTGSSSNNLFLFNPTSGTSQTAGIRLGTAGGWAIQLRTVENQDWLQIADSGGTVRHGWYAGRYYPGASSLNNSGIGYISGDGTNIGIGTTSPSYNFHVSGTVQLNSVRFLNGANYNENIRCYPGSNDYSSIALGAVAGDAGTGTGQWTFVRYPTANNNIFGIRHSTADVFNINTSGHITTPYQPAFYAWLPSGTTTTTGNYAGFTSTRLNRGSHYNTSTGRFTAPVAGVYRFLFAALYRQSTGTSSGEISISINGSNVSSRGMAYAVGAPNTDLHIPCIAELTISLNANDYVMPFIYSVGTNSDWYMGQNLAYFTGYLIG